MSKDDGGRVCPQCGAALVPSDTEDSEQIEIEVRAYRRRIRRRRYQRTCPCKDGPRTITAPPAPKLIPKGLLGVSVWVEPDQPRHPLAGIVHALGVADGRSVLVCAADMPFVTPDVIERIARADPGRSSAVVASIERELQPLLACYQPASLDPLTQLLSRTPGPLREAVAALRPVRYELEDPEVLFNVNSPSDLLQAAAMIDRRRASRR